MPICERFTKRAVDALPRPAARTFHWERGDGAVPGLGCKVEPSGRKVFVFQYDDAASRTRRITIGQYGSLTVEQARATAKQHAAAVAASRTDPQRSDPARARDEVRTNALADAKTPLMSELFDAFLVDGERRGRSDSTLREYRRLMSVTEVKHGAARGTMRPGALRIAFGNRRASSITRQEVRAFHTRHADTPAMANRYVVHLSSVFTFASRSDLFAGTNPCVGVELNEIEPHANRFATRTMSILETRSLLPRRPDS